MEKVRDRQDLIMTPIDMQDFGEPTGDCPFPKWEFISIPLIRKAGVITIFEKGAFFGSPRDAMSYANRPNKKKTFGAFMGFAFGEVIWGDPRINFMFYQEDQRAKNRKKKIRRNKHLKKVGIRQWEYNRYLKANPLERYLKGKEPKRPESLEARLDRLKKRDARKKQEEG